jgi:hypothetical protein
LAPISPGVSSRNISVAQVSPKKIRMMIALGTDIKIIVPALK